jgi:LPS sulfotransferase NodH
MAGESYYCMIHEGRCGSTVLASILSQHPGIVHLNEIVSRGAWVSDDFTGSDLERRRDDLGVSIAELCDFVRATAELSKSSNKPGRLFTGFEIKLNQLTRPYLACDLATLVDTLSAGLGVVRFVFVTRRNILRRHVSTLRCLHRNVTHAKDIADVNFEMVRIDPDSVRDLSYDFTTIHPDITTFLESSEARRLEVRDFALGRGELYLEYEDFERDPVIGAGSILDHLGLPRFLPESPLLKTGDRHLSDLVENFAEIADVLRGTRWENMLD